VRGFLIGALLLCACSDDANPVGAASATSGAGGFSPSVTTSSGSGSPGECSGLLPVTIRDFSLEHPDFETFHGTKAFLGIVESTLGPDDKPVYAHTGSTKQTTGPAEFAQWYNDVAGVNHSIPVDITLTETNPGEYVYDNPAFFPVDDQGFGNEGNEHNFHFTSEVHTSFEYQGGEVFTFTGDDDLWMFINGRLAIDLGGLHPPLSYTADLDAIAADLGIVPGNVYPMAIFHAERHTNASNFRIQTSISCFVPPAE